MHVNGRPTGSLSPDLVLDTIMMVRQDHRSLWVLKRRRSKTHDGKDSHEPVLGNVMVDALGSSDEST